uniref:(northern house mosquito) hypothetical protein n=1 Tax=Culex pipiens TaxID=7175 RepID=A0A8D8KJZ1_CULPI
MRIFPVDFVTKRVQQALLFQDAFPNFSLHRFKLFRGRIPGHGGAAIGLLIGVTGRGARLPSFELRILTERSVHQRSSHVTDLLFQLANVCFVVVDFGYFGPTLLWRGIRLVIVFVRDFRSLVQFFVPALK